MTPPGVLAQEVLIIDDDPSFRKLLELRLKSFLTAPIFTIYDSLSAARAALKDSVSVRYDLVVLDEHLPDGRGAEFLAEGWFRDLAVLSMSSDDSPDIPGSAISAGATFFLEKRSISEPLFRPLVLGVMERNRLQRELIAARVECAVVETVRTLVGTLRHEINNPLGAVIGGVYLFSNDANSSSEQKEAAALIEQSGKRIKHVLDKLCSTLELETVSKSNSSVFHIPGDKPWQKK